MEELPGALGTSASLALRLGQAIFAVASLLFMCLGVEFYSYTAFCFLVTIMGLVIPWSLTLAVVDVFSIFVKRPAGQRGVLSIVVIGDWALSFLSLAASCSTASVTSLLLVSEGFCDAKLCTRYQLSSAMAFLSWFLSLASSLFNLWLLPSV
ncbi:CASP-like protein 5C2 [Striga hermonthica]|uniref:CASP-like protein n=2 Tax=Striga TaxID=4169 RepID=A0A9N7RQP5_STRHE|nr:integral membrane family protein [Striga asiatica]CAA0840896.1 CASP-like protein 5C2 [Striga hermonthica]